MVSKDTLLAGKSSRSPLASDAPQTIDDIHVVEHVKEYFASLQEGENPDRQELLAQYPELADELAACLDALEFVHQMVPQIREMEKDASKGTPRFGNTQPLGPLGDFQILREIGRGGMGVVYEADQISLGRRVALKILPFAGVMDQRQLQRFKNEARAAASIKHPSVVDIHSVGCERGVHYYAMQYIEGQTLSQVIGELRQLSDLAPQDGHDRQEAVSRLTRDMVSEPLSPSGKKTSGDDRASDPNPELPKHARPTSDTDKMPRAGSLTKVAHSNRNREFFRSVAHLGIQAAEGLEHAHQMGVVHRDIKPSNLMIDDQKHLWITDFGLAMTQTETHITMTGDILGTLRYMSPEQASGAGHGLDCRTDVYSLGTTLYELLTLQPAFGENDSQKLLRQIAEEDPRSPRRLNSAIPRDLETIVLKAMAKHPGDRYGTAQALADDLGRFLDDKPIRARRLSLLKRVAKWTRRHRSIVATATLVSFITLMISLFLITGQRAEAIRQRNFAHEQRRIAEDREKLSLRHLYAANMNLAQQAWENGRVSRALELLEYHLPQPGHDDLRGFEWYHLWRLCHLDRSTLHGHTGSVISVAYSPDGRTLASGSLDGTVRLWVLPSGRSPATLRGHQAGVLSVAFSPDGTTLASASSDTTAKLWDVATGLERATLEGHGNTVKSITFSPDGQMLATAGHDGTAKLWEVSTGQELATLVGHTGPVWNVAYSPDGKTLATASHDSTVKLWDLATYQERASLEGHSAWIYSLAFAPDGRTVASGGAAGEVKLWDVVSETEHSSVEADTDAILWIAFAPDSKTFATASPSGVKLWNATTSQVKVDLSVHGGTAFAVAFSPDGKTFATGGGDKTVRIWDTEATQTLARSENSRAVVLEHQQGYVALKGDGFPVLSLAFSPDGRILASGGSELSFTSGSSDVRLWDVATGLEWETLEGHVNAGMSVAFSPDGRMLAAAKTGPMITLWDTITRQVLATLSESKNLEGFYVLAFSPDGKMLATGGGLNRTVKLWDVASRRAFAALEGHTGEIWCVAFSPDGKTLASGGFDSMVRLWDTATAQERGTLAGHAMVIQCIAFAPDGKTMATASFDGTVKLWDLPAGQCRTTLLAHTGGVFAVAYSPDGQTLATGSYDKSIKLWDPLTGQERTTLIGHTEAVWAIAFSPDGKTLASGSLDKTILLWRAATEEDVLADAGSQNGGSIP